MTATETDTPAALRGLATFPLLDALFGRRARRFGLGMAIPDGPLAYASQHAPLTLSEAERTLLVLCGAGISGWNFGIPHTASGAPDSGCNYAHRFVGRTYPSGAAVHSSELLITDDSGSYITQFRDLDPTRQREYADAQDLDRLVEVARQQIVRLAPGRVTIPHAPPHVSGHNLWVANRPGTTLFIPVVNLTEHALNSLAIGAQAGAITYDTEQGRLLGEPTPLIRRGLLNPATQRTLRDMEQALLTSAAVEAGVVAHNIVLTMQAIGLGGWLYSGINAPSLLGAYADQGIPGFGFRFATPPGATTPNPIGLDNYIEGLVPPYTVDMHTAVAQFTARKFGPGGTYDPSRPGPFSESAAIKGRVERYSPELQTYLGSVAQDIYESYGKFPATVPSIFANVYAQAHHLDLDFYDNFIGADAYLETHAQHLAQWHGGADAAD